MECLNAKKKPVFDLRDYEQERINGLLNMEQERIHWRRMRDFVSNNEMGDASDARR